MNQTDQYIARAADHSRFLQSQLMARPWLAPRIGAVLERALERADLQAFLDAESLTEANLGSQLRRLRAYVYAHVMVRDLNGLAPLPEVTGAMTMLAEVAVETSQRVLTAQLAARHGMPRSVAESDAGENRGAEQQLIVIGMGKLGGGELNVSSDIDLIFVYPDDGETPGDEKGLRAIGAFEFFTKLGRAMIAAISEMTAEGFVFRVDMRLRPNGDSGPLVANFDMLETYFISQGREWERYAWIKARALTGERHDELDAIVRPFVFRKYLDFGSINAMRALHAQIRREVARREMADNIKLGPGGIREIEFIAQVFQLIRGGRDAGLRVRPTLQVLDALALRGLMPDATVAELNAAYDFLRRLEHRIQYLDDAQTHMLPASPQDRLRIAVAMNFPTVESLMAALDAHRVIVSRHFDGVFSEPAVDEVVPDGNCAGAWSGDSEADNVCSALEKFGYHDKQQLCVRLRGFRDGPRYRAMSEEARSRLDAIMPRVLALAAARSNPDQTLIRSIELLEAICRRSSYLALLQQYPQALARVVELVSSSSWAASYLTLHPLLLDELLDIRNSSENTDSTRFAAELSLSLDALGDDTERQMDLMREAHHAQLFRMLNRDLAGDLTVEALSDKLSELADIVLGETLEQCWKKLGKRHAATHRFAIIGYGKLGGKELGYASDLDIVFLHDDPDPESQPVYARLAQRINTWISSRTSSGLLFETDLRLRPNGDSGLLVSSLEAFEQYQRESAWVWEHQALTRARFCAGNAEVGARFERLRHDLLCQPRDIIKLRAEVQAMRKKMMDAHANKGEGFQLKHDAGGLVHVEFLVQYLVLAYAHQWPELAANIGNIALLKLAANVGLLPADIAYDAANAYRDLRRAQHALRLNEHDSRIDDDSLAGPRAAVDRLWQCVFELL